MNILFIHQNFPAQFLHLAPALAAAGHNVTALTLRNFGMEKWNGVQIVRYGLTDTNTKEIHPWVIDYESKIIRGKACLNAAIELRKKGYNPTIIIAHPGWGESLFIKQIWPDAKLKLYCEYFYNTSGYDVGFDNEFFPYEENQAARVTLKNSHLLLNFQHADKGLSPTHFQADTFPAHLRDKITVIHDGIDTQILKPCPDAKFDLDNGDELTCHDEIITFVSRALEPYRGFHIFMRALPRLLSERPNAVVLIVGYEGIAYGNEAPKMGSWKNLICSEVFPNIPASEISRIHFLGTLSRARFTSLLQVSTVHVYLTYPFVLSWSLIEAMSVGCAIVASDTNPLREVIEHKKTGLLCDFFNIEQLALQVTQLLENIALRKELSEAARKFAIKNFDLHSVCLPRQKKWVEEM